MRRFLSSVTILWAIVVVLVTMVILVGLSLGIEPPWRPLLKWAALCGIAATAVLALCIWLDTIEPWPDLDVDGSQFPIWPLH